MDFQAFSFYLNILEASYDIHRQSNGRNPAMHCEISLYGEGFSIMWPLTHISAEWDPERGMITANGVWLSINPWTDISQGCWGHMSNAINPSNKWPNVKSKLIILFWLLNHHLLFQYNKYMRKPFFSLFLVSSHHWIISIWIAKNIWGTSIPCSLFNFQHSLRQTCEGMSRNDARLYQSGKPHSYTVS